MVHFIYYSSSWCLSLINKKPNEKKVWKWTTLACYIWPHCRNENTIKLVSSIYYNYYFLFYQESSVKCRGVSEPRWASLTGFGWPWAWGQSLNLDMSNSWTCIVRSSSIYKAVLLVPLKKLSHMTILGSNWIDLLSHKRYSYLCPTLICWIFSMLDNAAQICNADF